MGVCTALAATSLPAAEPSATKLSFDLLRDLENTSFRAMFPKPRTRLNFSFLIAHTCRSWSLERQQQVSQGEATLVNAEANAQAMMVAPLHLRKVQESPTKAIYTLLKRTVEHLVIK